MAFSSTFALPCSALKGVSLGYTLRRHQVSRQPAAVVTQAVLTKKEIAAQLAEKTDLPQSKATAILNQTLELIVDAVASGEKVTFTGFGTFEPRHRAARKGRNPRSGEELDIAASTSPAFSAGKSFKDAVKGAAAKAPAPAA